MFHLISISSHIIQYLRTIMNKNESTKINSNRKVTVLASAKLVLNRWYFTIISLPATDLIKDLSLRVSFFMCCRPGSLTPIVQDRHGQGLAGAGGVGLHILYFAQQLRPVVSGPL